MSERPKGRLGYPIIEDKDLSAGFRKDCPTLARVVDTPLCNACKNLILGAKKEYCKAYNPTPNGYGRCKAYDCPEFIIDRDALFFDSVKDSIRKRQEKGIPTVNID